MNEIEETRDRALLRRIFARDPVGAVYQLGDLAEPAFGCSQWFVAEERAVLLIYRGLAVPFVALFGDPAALAGLLRSVELPDRFYTKLAEGSEDLLAGWRLARPERLYVMGRQGPGEPAPACPGATFALTRDGASLAPLYRDYPGNFFDPSQAETGVYAAAYLEGVPAACAGTHAFAPEEGAAAVGNVVTAARHRGRGLCRALMPFLCAELARRGVRHVGLHVARENRAAIACYLRAGFAIHSEITQYEASR